LTCCFVHPIGRGRFFVRRDFPLGAYQKNLVLSLATFFRHLSAVSCLTASCIGGSECMAWLHRPLTRWPHSFVQQEDEKPSCDGNGVCVSLWRTALFIRSGGVATKSGEFCLWARTRKISTFAICDIFAMPRLCQSLLEMYFWEVGLSLVPAVTMSSSVVVQETIGKNVLATKYGSCDGLLCGEVQLPRRGRRPSQGTFAFGRVLKYFGVCQCSVPFYFLNN
jgi:hypothetical protein